MKIRMLLLCMGILAVVTLMSGCASFDTLDPLAPQNEEYVLNN